MLSQVHELDYLYSMLGTPRHLLALGGHWSVLEIDVGGTASILLECTLKGQSLGVPCASHIASSILPCGSAKQWAENGKVVMDLIANEMTLYTNGQAEPERFKVDSFERNQLFVEELKHFLHCVETRQLPMVTLRDGAESLRTALAARNRWPQGGWSKSGILWNRQAFIDLAMESSSQSRGLFDLAGRWR